MSTYRTLKPIAVSVDDVVHHYRAGIFVELDDKLDGIDALVAKGRVELVHASATTKDVDLVDEDPEAEKPLKDRTIPELIKIAKKAGVSEDSVKHLKKDALVEAVERLTRASED